MRCALIVLVGFLACCNGTPPPDAGERQLCTGVPWNGVFQWGCARACTADETRPRDKPSPDCERLTPFGCPGARHFNPYRQPAMDPNDILINRCTTDAECIGVSVDCCSCDAGSEEPINRQYYDAWYGVLEYMCGASTCRVRSRDEAVPVFCSDAGFCEYMAP